MRQGEIERGKREGRRKRELEGEEDTERYIEKGE